MSANPMHEARTALAAHPRCGAQCRTTGQPCRNPAMTNGRCRMHGGKSSGAPLGEAHPKFKHGQRAIQAREMRREVRFALKAIHQLLKSIIVGNCVASDIKLALLSRPISWKAGPSMSARANPARRTMRDRSLSGVRYRATSGHAA